ncbi:hypothetical protein H6P81_006727 [Aristolochia fimbriata]|uniref:Acyl-activating enzyme 5, peroxisomal n=1 Tax=Aristolochia fimbriata TaxID=158543 RepID=A0AAV7EYG6_ARIFI|nr:hypothetical protein H6P81_006727 [Aristolochia fimbriata]
MECLKPCEANSCPLTPLGFLERAATVYGDSPSIVYNDTLYTWSQTYQRCLNLASALLRLGINTGDVVSVVAPNVPAMYEVHFGVPMSGAVLNNINTRLDARTVSLLLRHAEPKLVFVDVQFYSLVQKAVAALDRNKPVVIVIEDDEGYYHDQISSYHPATTTTTYRSLIETGDPTFRWVRPQTEWAPMVLNYTSGTTASPKGVVHCHRGLFAVAVDNLIDWSVPHQPVYLWTLPMFHTNGWSFPWGIAAVGGTNVCLRKFDAAAIFAAIKKHKVTHMCGAPVVLNMLANHAPGTTTPPLPHAVHVLTAGAPPPAAVLHRTEALGFSVSHGYGLSETSAPVVSCAWKKEWDRYPAEERARLKARQGVRTVCTEAMDVVDADTGEPVKRDGEALGEVVIRGACVMLGYLKDPESTRKAIRGGWFYTGDVGVMHPDGYLEIKDRSKDVIISGGENLSSVDVESVLYQHPAVNEAAVVARPDEFWGESPCAFLSLKDDEARETSTSPSEKEIIEFCRERMPRYTVPKTVVFVSELPKTATGKIQKSVLRDSAKKLGVLKSSPFLSRV